MKWNIHLECNSLPWGWKILRLRYEQYFPMLVNEKFVYTPPFASFKMLLYIYTREQILLYEDLKNSIAYVFMNFGLSTYEAFHVNCPSARHASPKSCYF